MSEFAMYTTKAVTLEEWRRMKLTRPLTNDPIGGSGASMTRRANGAAASRAVTPAPDPWERESRDPTTAMPDADEVMRARDRARRPARRSSTQRSRAVTAAIDAATALTHPQTQNGPQDAA